MTKYIVSAEQIINTVESALNEKINDCMIIDRLMEDIENNILTVLEDNCEEYTDD